MSAMSLAVLNRSSAEAVFHAGEQGPLWRVSRGLVRLDRHHGTATQAVQLALPGDLIGVEALCGQPYRLSAVAFTPSRLERVSLDGHRDAREPLLQQALLQHQTRCQDMAALRTGTVPQRIAHLLRLLGFDRQPPQGDCDDCARFIRQSLPTLREVAQMVDAQTETVCRAMAQLLPPRRARADGAALVDRCWRNNAVRIEALV
ncbi:cyclic nucleotide-binding domain-containing protein [Hydrogenophaga sp. MI9]|uniref:cyclic nucleotide-binding domain-containing protein n=1 Tax=Hydrogenophaga sp. MI9 TaxID=3453719 RepID=UPI003EE8C158